MWVTSFGNGIKVGLMTGTGMPEFEQQATVYPNPGNGLFKVDWSGHSNARGIVFDSQGRQVGELALLPGVNQIDLRSISKGLYFLRVENEMHKILVE